MYHPDRKEQNHASDRRRIIEILCTECECSSYQISRVEYIVDEIRPLDHFYPTVQTEKIILGAISLCLDAEVTDFENRTTNRDEFLGLMEDVDLDIDQLWSIRRKIRSEVDSF